MHFKCNKFPFAHLSLRVSLLLRRIKASQACKNVCCWWFEVLRQIDCLLETNLKLAFVYRATLNMSRTEIFIKMTARDIHEIDFFVSFHPLEIDSVNLIAFALNGTLLKFSTCRWLIATQWIHRTISNLFLFRQICVIADAVQVFKINSYLEIILISPPLNRCWS